MDAVNVGADDSAAATAPAAAEHAPDLAGHPGPRQYIVVAVWLAIATAFEVGLYYVTAIPHGIYVLLLIAFMAIKFTLVVLWFMHLRFDSRIFRRLFFSGLVLAITVYLIVLLTFKVFFH